MIQEQTRLFLWSLAAGAALMLLYDLFRILRLAFPAPPWAVFGQDVLFFAIAGVTTFLFLLYSNGGVLRFFVFLGELIGGTLYYCTVGALVYKAAGWIIRGVKAVLRFLWTYLLRPVLRLMWKLTAPFRFLWRKVRSLCVCLRLKVKPGDLRPKFAGWKKKFCLQRGKNSKNDLQQGMVIGYNHTIPKRRRPRQKTKGSRI